MQETTNLQLGLVEGADKANWFNPGNDNMQKIDDFAGDVKAKQTADDVKFKEIDGMFDNVITASTVSSRQIAQNVVDIQNLKDDQFVQGKDLEKVHHEVAVLEEAVKNINELELPQVDENFRDLSNQLAITSTSVNRNQTEVEAQKAITDALQEDVDGYSAAIENAQENAGDAKGASETVQYVSGLGNIVVDVTSMNWPATSVVTVDIYAEPSARGYVTGLSKTEIEGNLATVIVEVHFDTAPTVRSDVTAVVRRA